MFVNPYCKGTPDHSLTSCLLCLCRQCSLWEGIKSQECLCASNSAISVRSNWQFGWQSELVLPWASLRPCGSQVLDMSSWLWRSSIFREKLPLLPGERKPKQYRDTVGVIKVWTPAPGPPGVMDPVLKCLWQAKLGGREEERAWSNVRDTSVGISYRGINLICLLDTSSEKICIAYRISFRCSWVSLDSQVFRQLPGYLRQLTASKSFGNCSRKDRLVSSLEGAHGSCQWLCIILLLWRN